MNTRSLLVAMIVFVAVAAGGLTFYWYNSKSSGEPYGAPFALVDQRGQPITEAAFRAQPSAVFFGFTHCPEICPTTLFELDGWLATMGPEGDKIRAFFVTVDPERDTPEIMNQYVSNVSARITGVTGEPDDIAAMTKAWGIYSRKVDTGDGDYTMDHTASIILLGRGGDFAGTIAYAENPENAITKLRRLAAGL